jgi:heat shock protein HtpX
MGNNLKTAFLLTAMTVFVVMVGQAIGGRNGAVMALCLAGAMNFFSYFYSDKLAIFSSGAQPVTREELPRAYQIVERLCAKTGLPMPKLFVIPTGSPNAFATGRNPEHASLAVTAGILDLLTDDELEGVLAHELGHVRNRDILISSIAATFAGAVTILARMAGYAAMFGGGGRDRDRDGGGGIISAIAMMILAPIAAMLIQMAVSRSREYQADATGAHFTGNPGALASALKKIETYSVRVPMQVSPATAHMYIIQPLLGGVSFGSLFSTHPPTAERIARLMGMRAGNY